MSKEELDNIVQMFRVSVCEISDKEVADVIWLCKRKIEMIGQNEDYMELLLIDELNRYCIRNLINAVYYPYAGRMCKEECAVCV